MCPSAIREFIFVFPLKTLDALQYVHTVVAYSPLPLSSKVGARKSFCAFPEMTVVTLVWRACIFLLLHATFATVEIVFARPLRGKETVFEHHEIALDTSL